MTKFLDLAKQRYSVRKFADKELTDGQINELLEAAKVAPTACNNQPQKIYVVRSAEGMAKLNTLSPCMYGAKVCFMIGYDKNLAAKVSDREGYCFGETDCAIVTSHIMLQAADMGLGSCWVGRFNPDETHKAFDLPENIVLCDLLPVGYSDMGPSPRHETYRDQDETVEFI